MAYLLRRVVATVLLAMVAASFAYLLAATTLHPRASLQRQAPDAPPGAVDARLTELNANDRTPLVRRYVRWAAGAGTGDLGRSADGEPVRAELGRRARMSLRLLLPGAVLGCALGILAGSCGAIRPYGHADRLIGLGSFVTLAVPVFVLAVTLRMAAQWLGLPYAGHVLPVLTIALAQAALYGRYQRHLMLDLTGAAFMRTAIAKGLRRRTAMLRHALPVALVPMAAYFAFNTALLLTGLVVIERIFARHGMGEWLIDSIARGDVNAVAAISGSVVVVTVAARLLSELATAWLDPRVRTGPGGEAA